MFEEENLEVLMEDGMIIELFYKRSEDAIYELDAKYGKLCRSIAFNILNDIHDVEESVNDGYLGAWNSIPPATPNPLQAYICKIVRNTSLNLYHKKSAVKRNSNFDIAMDELDFQLSSPNLVESEVQVKELSRMIQGFLDNQKKENRVVFMLRYAFCYSYSQIAKKTGISEKNVSVILTRLRRDLKQHLTEKGYYYE